MSPRDDTTQVVTIPYCPRTREFHLPVHRALEAKRFGVVVSHRRFGKTVLAINQLIKDAIRCPRERPRFAYVGPTLRQAKTVAWDYLKYYTRPIRGLAVNEQEMRVDLPNGAQVRLFGADNPDALRGTYFDGVVPDEYGLMQGRLWTEILRPALSDRSGWALFLGTPNGHNQFWELRNLAAADPEWFLFEWPVSVTGLIGAQELESARRVMTQDEYAQEYECSFDASVKGAVYGEEMAKAREEGRITRVPFDPMLPVNTSWDLGMADAMAVWFDQTTPRETRFIDYFETEGEGLPALISVLQRKPYVYGKHFAPVDIRVRELGTGVSRWETAKKLGLDFTTVPACRSLQDDIHAVRMLLPRCWFDLEHTRRGVEALQSYRWEYNTRLDEFKATPMHNWASHGADALRTRAQGRLQFEDAPKKKARRERFYPQGEGAWAM